MIPAHFLGDVVVYLPWHRSYQPSQTPAWRGSGSLLLSVIALSQESHLRHTLEANIQIGFCVDFDGRRHGCDD